MRAGHALEVRIARGREPSPLLDEIRALARGSGVMLQEVRPDEVEEISSGQNAQGVAARIRTPRLLSVSDLLARTENSSKPAFFLILDQIQDPHNVGALIRTANAAGADGLILPERHSAGMTAAVARTSAGAIYSLPIAEVTNLARSLDALKSAGVWIVGLDAEAQLDLFSADLTVPVALVVGAEGSGLRQLTRRSCDLLVKLPMHGAISSLNASVAGAIAMYEVLRQRGSR